MKQIDEIKVGDLVVAQMFNDGYNTWVVRGSRRYLQDGEYLPVTANRKNYEPWTFKVIDVSSAHQMVKLEVPRITWKRMPILHWSQALWVPPQNLEMFKDILCMDCNFSCAQKCKKALKKIDA